MEQDSIGSGSDVISEGDWRLMKHPSDEVCIRLEAYGNICSWNMAFRDIRTDLVCRLKNWYPLMTYG